MESSIALRDNAQGVIEAPPKRTISVRDPERIATRHLSILLFLFTLTLYSYFLQQAGWNQTSRMALILSTTQHGQLTIDRYEGLTGDKALYGGHFYSDKSPGTAIVGIPAFLAVLNLQHLDRYAIVRDGTDTGQTLLYGLRYPTYLVTVVAVAIPSAILAVLLFLLLLQLSHHRGWSFALTLCYAFGTLAFPFSTMLFGHQLAATFAFGAFFLLVQARLKQRNTALLLLAAGILSGLAVLMEYPSAIIVVALLAYAVTFVRRKLYLVWFVLGGLPSAVLLALMNWVSFGSPTRFAYSFEADQYFSQNIQKGLFGITVPRWESFFEVLIGSRGLLTQSLFLWLLPFAVWQMYRTKVWWRECALCVGVGVLFLLWNSSYYLPLGGDTPGARFLVPVLPFLVVPLAFLSKIPRPYAGLVRLALILSGIASMALTFIITCVDPQVPEAVRQPWSEYWLTHMIHGEVILNLGTLRFGMEGLRSFAPLAFFALITIDTLLLIALGRRQATYRAQIFRLGLLAVLYLVVAFPINLLQPLQPPSFFLGR